jgi:site-specific DNA recombinase
MSSDHTTSPRDASNVRGRGIKEVTLMQADSSGDRLVVVYLRVSTDAQDITRQTVQHERAQSDYPSREITEIRDPGVSAYKTPIFDRPGGRRLCDLIQAGRVEAIYADAQDRLSRGEDLEWVTFKAMCSAVGTRIVIDGREQGNDIAGSRLEGFLKAIIARQESEEKAHRARGAKRVAASRGRRNGGPRPFGYEHKQEVGADGCVTSRLLKVPGEADAVETMFLDYAFGKSQSTIARRLNEAGIRTTRGQPWSQPRVGQILRNPLYRGLVHYKDELFSGNHEAIVSHELWGEVERVRAEASRHGSPTAGGRPPKGRHLLTGGVLRCACGAAMRARTQRKDYGSWQAYLCEGRHSGQTTCTMSAVSREDVDNAVWAYFENVGIDYEATVREHETWRSLELSNVARQIDEQETELARVTTDLDRIKGDYRAGKLAAEDWADFRDEITSEIIAATAAVEQLRSREQEIREAELASDADAEMMQELQLIRDALHGLATGDVELDVARRAVRRLFESFTLHRYEGHLPDVLDADLALGDWYIVPRIRADALLSPLVIGRDPDGDLIVEQDEALQRIALSAKPKGSLR